MPRTLSSFLEEKYKERLRDNYRYTFRQFADDLGVKRENLHSWLKRKIVPRVDHCHQMATALGLPLVDFLVLSGLLSESQGALARGVSVQDIEDLPEAVRSAMATEDWVQLCPSPDEIEMVSRADLKDAQSVLRAIRDLPWRKVKMLFQKHSVPREVQEECYRFCRAVVFDWEGRFNTEEETGN